MSNAHAPVLTPHYPGGSLIASAKRLTGRKLRNRLGKARSGESVGWQEESWEMYDLVGEQRFLSNTLGGRTGQALFYVGRVDAVDADPVRLEEGDPDFHLSGYLSDLGSRAHLAQLVTRLTVNLFMAGEGWLVGIPADSVAEPEDEIPATEYVWRMLSLGEVSVNASSGRVELELEELDGGKREYDPDDLWLVRIWNPHPKKFNEADAATRACLPILREIVSLSMHISAQVDSRLAGAGLLLIPEGAKRAVNTAAGLPEDSDQDVFTESLIEAMVTPISDRGSASALVPLVVTVPNDLTDKFKHISFSTPLDAEARALRDDAIRRLANSQDAPPELLLGTASMNHWGAWLIKEETVNTHIEPRLALICDALTSQYLQPMMMLDGMSEEEASQYVIWYDVSHLYSRPNRSGDAKELHNRGILSDEALRRETGFDASDAPEVGEQLDEAVRLALDLVAASPALMAQPGLEALVASIRAVLDGTDTPAAPSAETDPETTLIPETSEDEPAPASAEEDMPQ